MINVKYWPRELRLTVEGHALEEKDNNPAICNAASMLVFALMNTLDGFKLRHWVKGVAYFDSGSGYAYMRAFKPRWHKFKAVRVAFGLVFGGLAMLAQQYPDAVKVDVCTGEPFDDEAVIKNASLIAEKK